MPYHFLPDGTPLWFEECGTGQTIVLLQGLQFPSGYFWSRNIDALAAQHRVIQVDLRGQGLSGKPDVGHSIKQNAADLEHFLAGLDIDDAFLFGVAFGGLVILRYLQDFGDARLRAVGLCEMTPRLVSQEGWEHPTFGDFPQEAAEGFGNAVRADRGVLTGFLQSAFAVPPDAQAQADMLAQMYLTPTNTVATLIDDMARQDFRAMLPTITKPVLLVYGRGNNTVMPGAVGQWIASQIPQAELVELPDGGHSIFWDSPDAFNTALISFAERY